MTIYCDVCKAELVGNNYKWNQRVWYYNDFDLDGDRFTSKLHTCMDCVAKCEKCSRVLGGYDITCDPYSPVLKCHGCMLGIPKDKIPKTQNEYSSPKGQEYLGMVCRRRNVFRCTFYHTVPNVVCVSHLIHQNLAFQQKPILEAFIERLSS